MPTFLLILILFVLLGGGTILKFMAFATMLMLGAPIALILIAIVIYELLP